MAAGVSFPNFSAQELMLVAKCTLPKGQEYAEMASGHRNPGQPGTPILASKTHAAQIPSAMSKLPSSQGQGAAGAAHLGMAPSSFTALTSNVLSTSSLAPSNQPARQVGQHQARGAGRIIVPKDGGTDRLSGLLKAAQPL